VDAGTRHPVQGMDNELLEKLGKLTQEILSRVKVDALECIFECDIDKTAE
jgi:hypothetical protein